MSQGAMEWRRLGVTHVECIRTEGISGGMNSCRSATSPKNSTDVGLSPQEKSEQTDLLLSAPARLPPSYVCIINRYRSVRGSRIIALSRRAFAIAFFSTFF